MVRIRIHNAVRVAMAATLGDVNHYLPPEAVGRLSDAVANQVIIALRESP